LDGVPPDITTSETSWKDNLQINLNNIATKTSQYQRLNLLFFEQEVTEETENTTIVLVQGLRSLYLLCLLAPKPYSAKSEKKETRINANMPAN
jgi:hypothetical protein